MNTMNIVAGKYSSNQGKEFTAINPANGTTLSAVFSVASQDQIDTALRASADAFKLFRSIDKGVKSAFLRAIAEELERAKEAIIAMAMQECALTEARLQGEMARTTGQLRMFADLVEEGSWVDAYIETAQPDRKPMPRADIRRMLVPLGPVVMFGASNFPLAFSVAGGDTAAALAAGCPVVVKVHPAHPGTSALTAEAILKAIEATGVPAGVFSMLYDDGHQVGTQLVKHPETKAVAFTGSLKGGMALHNLAQSRATPIPVFAEMGSTNPVFIFPEAMQLKSEEIAQKFALSISNGAGQFCTKPGLIFAMDGPQLSDLKKHFTLAMEQAQPVCMLTKGIFENFEQKAELLMAEEGVELLTGKDSSANVAQPKLAVVDANKWLQNPLLSEEVFGPFALLIVMRNEEELAQVINQLKGQLTTTVIAEANDAAAFQTEIENLADKAGRLIFNGVPTGVEVHTAIHHGGPFPATNNQFTSVGSTSIYRFARPIAYQDWPDMYLPNELKAGNPYQISRRINNVMGKV